MSNRLKRLTTPPRAWGFVVALWLSSVAGVNAAGVAATPKAIYDTWGWIPVQGAICRDGSGAGVGLRLHKNSRKLLIYLQGGGACYDAKSCEQNAKGAIAGAKYDQADFQRWRRVFGSQGVFNAKHAENPFADWNHVFVAYCTGDLHAGLRENARVPGVPKPQQFVGSRNLQILLFHLARYFKETTEVALVGASAGGYGVLLNFTQVAQTFPGLPITALVDAAPVLSDGAFKTSCFQDKVLKVFNLQLPPACRNCRNLAAGR